MSLYQDLILGTGPPAPVCSNDLHIGSVYIDQCIGYIYIYWDCRWIKIVNIGDYVFDIEVKSFASGPSALGPLSIVNENTIVFYDNVGNITYSIGTTLTDPNQNPISITFSNNDPTLPGLVTGSVYLNLIINEISRWDGTTWNRVYISNDSKGYMFITQNNSSPITISNSPGTQLFTGTTSIVVGNGWLLTNGSFVAPTTGMYRFNIMMLVEYQTVDPSLGIVVNINGVQQLSTFFNWVDSNSPTRVYTSFMLSLTSRDNMTLYAIADNINISNVGSQPQLTIKGKRIIL